MHNGTAVLNIPWTQLFPSYQDKQRNKSHIIFPGLWNLGHEGSADPGGPPGLPGQVKGLTVLPPLLLMPQGPLSPFGGCPSTRAEVCQPLQKTEGVGTHNSHTEGSPYHPHDLAPLAGPGFPAKLELQTSETLLLVLNGWNGAFEHWGCLLDR